MSLTVVGDIELLWRRMEEINASLSSQIRYLQEKVDHLQALSSESAILAQPDDDWVVVKKKRDYLLKTTDWTMIPGTTVDQHAWSKYRQILRDIPQTFGAYGPDKVKWPVAPSTSGPNTIKEGKV
jgi:hypothetical protein